MSKAEDRALEAFPLKIDGDSRGSYDLNVVKRIIYQQGYEQAEKDLSDISWIKEISGVKEMKRAKEEALKVYPPRSIAANYDTIARRDAFEFGYLKAEKDLEFTWEDMVLFRTLFDATDANIRSGSIKIQPMTKEYYQEILKRFKERKEK